MSKNRLEAFSDGVIAILITIMVFDIKLPAGTDWPALVRVMPLVGTYFLSFLYLGIYWNNHHHLLSLTTHVTGGILWANLHLLFWLSLFPFTTNWLGASHFSSVPAAAYGIVLFLAAVAYLLLQNMIIAVEGPDSALQRAIGSDLKGKLSAVLYLVGVGAAFVNPWIAIALYVLVSLIWLVPDRRIEARQTDGIRACCIAAGSTAGPAPAPTRPEFPSARCIRPGTPCDCTARCSSACWAAGRLAASPCQMAIAGCWIARANENARAQGTRDW